MKYLLIILITFLFNIAAKPNKIIALIPVRNGATIIEQCLRCLYAVGVDSMIIHNDASTDQTSEILNELSQELPIEKIINSTTSYWEERDEAAQRQMLLDEGRKAGGTHFVLIDTDELFSAPCAQNKWLRNTIISLKPGQVIYFKMPHVWRNCEFYRTDDCRWAPQNCWCNAVFCDDGIATMSNNKDASYSGFIHLNRIPNNRQCTVPDLFIEDLNYCLIHFRFASWPNIQLKRIWYMCLELIRSKEHLSAKQPFRSARDINFFYSAIEDFSENNIQCTKVPDEWFDYDFFNADCYMQEETWRKEQIDVWFKKYNPAFFASLDIWHTAQSKA